MSTMGLDQTTPNIACLTIQKYGVNFPSGGVKRSNDADVPNLQNCLPARPGGDQRRAQHIAGFFHKREHAKDQKAQRSRRWLCLVFAGLKGLGDQFVGVAVKARG